MQRKRNGPCIFFLSFLCLHHITEKGEGPLITDTHQKQTHTQNAREVKKKGPLDKKVLVHQHWNLFPLTLLPFFPAIHIGIVLFSLLHSYSLYSYLLPPLFPSHLAFFFKDNNDQINAAKKNVF